MDSIWDHIATIKKVDGSHSFELLLKVAKFLPIVWRQTHTPTRSCLDPSKALASIIQMKLANQTLAAAIQESYTQYNSMHRLYSVVFVCMDVVTICIYVLRGPN